MEAFYEIINEKLFLQSFQQNPHHHAVLRLSYFVDRTAADILNALSRQKRKSFQSRK